MSDIFDEDRMMQALGRYVPAGETVRAGIHGIGIDSEVKEIFGKCVLVDGRLYPDENGGVLEVSKEKYSRCDVYIGITEHYLMVVECEEYKHHYEFNQNPDLRGAVVREVRTCIPIEDMGICFPPAEIKKCEIKNGWMGSVNCSVTMKDGSFLKLMFPKRGGLGKGMPHHKEYRDAIIARLGNGNGLG